MFQLYGPLMTFRHGNRLFGWLVRHLMSGIVLQEMRRSLKTDLQCIFRRLDRKASTILQSSVAPNLLQVFKEAQASRQTLECLSVGLYS